MKRLGFVLACALALGCETTKRVAWESGLPLVPGDFRVESVDKRAGTWLDTRLSAEKITRRVLVPADDEGCKQMIVAGGSLTWSRTEPYGHLSKGELRCPIVGLGDLEKWRDSRSRRAQIRGPYTTTQTRFELVREDEHYRYARGGFSLAGYLGWTPGTDQVIALLPRGEPCDAAPADEILTMQFKVEGRPAFALLTPKGLCPIDAIVAAPRAEPDAAPAE
jgi:hypothetical protein